MLHRGRWSLALGSSVAAVCAAAAASAHTVYLANDNHTDYNWNATAAEYDAAMLAELDYYRARVDATAGSPPDEQSRYVADGWWWLWLYEKHRPAEAFADLVAKLRSGHITVPLNPFVTLYGAMSTEMAIRAGYYPGRMARRHGIPFVLGYASVENETAPWGLASLFAGSGVRYAWKGVCGCHDAAPHGSVAAELFHWQGADARSVLMKWYRLAYGNSLDRGGYGEARVNLGVSQLAEEIAKTEADQPGIPVTGLFGAGHDDVSYQSQEIVAAAAAFNAARAGHHAVVSNGVDFFQALEAGGQAASLPVLRGGFGNDWDTWPARLAERTARQRRAVEALRTAEALAVFAHWARPGFWAPVQASLELGLTSTWKYFEHGWGGAPPAGPTSERVAADKETWTRDVEGAVARATAAGAEAFAALFATPDEDRVAVLNPLAFERTDVVDHAVAGPGPYVVTDVATGEAVPSQVDVRAGAFVLRFLASGVPSFGYRVYRLAPGTPSTAALAATVTPGERSIESERYRVALGPRGEIASARDRSAEPGRELAGAGGLADFGAGVLGAVYAENAGPVSATLRADLSQPARTVRVTLLRVVDRIEIESEVLENLSGETGYGFDVALERPRIRFEEVGAIARPGLVSEGGDYLPGTRASRLTANHFVGFEGEGAHVVLSNADTYLMQVGSSTDARFDLGSSRVSLRLTERSSPGSIQRQGGDARFLSRFALSGGAGPFDAPEAMRASLALQNPLRAVALPRRQPGPFAEPVRSFLSISAPDVVVTAVKPAEEGERGLVVRVWELAGRPARFEIDAAAFAPRAAWRANLVETDQAPVPVAAGRIQAELAPNEIGTFRFVPAASPHGGGGGPGSR
jgi:alpha-mannosidase